MSEIFDLSLLQSGGVLSNHEMNWQSCGSCWVNIGDHVEVKESGTITFNNDLVDEGTWSWVAVMSIDLLKESGGNLGVDENIQDLWVVVWSKASNSLLNLADFLTQNFFLESWATDTISVDND